MNTAKKRVPAADLSKCIRCNICINTCPVKAISAVINSCCAKCVKYCVFYEVTCMHEYLDINFELCDSCGKCIESCPRGALSWEDIDKASRRKNEL